MWFPNRSDTNRPVQSQKRARILKFRIQVEEQLYYSSSENKGADQLRGYREADLRLCFRLCRLLVFSRGGPDVERHLARVNSMAGNNDIFVRVDNVSKKIKYDFFLNFGPTKMKMLISLHILESKRIALLLEVSWTRVLIRVFAFAVNLVLVPL